MCEYRIDNQCQINKEVCPWVYWCEKLNTWRDLPKAPKQCKLADKQNIPKGCYKVEFERHGYLYVNVNGAVVKLKNTLDNIPIFVKLYKSHGEWKIKKENKGNED